MIMLAPYIEQNLRYYYYPNIVKGFPPIVDLWKVEVLETFLLLLYSIFPHLNVTIRKNIIFFLQFIKSSYIFKLTNC